MQVRARRSRYYSAILLLFLSSLGFLSVSAAAAPFEDVTDAMADAAGIQDFVMEAILACVFTAVVLVMLGLARVPIEAILIVLIMLLTIWVIVGWFDYWILVVAVLAIIALAGRKIAEWIGVYPSGA